MRRRAALLLIWAGLGPAPAAQNVFEYFVAPARPGNRRNSEADLLPLGDGRLLLAWTRFSTDQAEDWAPASIAARLSEDGGRSWGAEFVLQENIGRMNVMEPDLLRLRSGKVLLFFCRKNSPADCLPMVRLSRDDARTFGPPAPLPVQPYPSYTGFNHDRAIQLRSGRVLLPVFFTGDYRKDPHMRSRVYYSDDEGRTWRASRTVVDVPESRAGAQEPGVVELRDGRVMLWLRTDTGRMYQAFSSDRGESWTAPEPSPVVSPLSPQSIKRLPWSGELLLVWNNSDKQRFPLSLALSRDEGRSWSPARNLDEDPAHTYAYTSIEFLGRRVLFTYYAGPPAGARGHDWSLKFKSVPAEWLYGGERRPEGGPPDFEQRRPDRLPPGKAAVGAELIEVRKIWDRAPHNAFTDLIRFRGRWFCAFREASRHVSPDGALRVLVSRDARRWESAALIGLPGRDLRDPKLTGTPDGRLMLTTYAVARETPEAPAESRVWFSRDGRRWESGEPIGEPNFWLWRVTWRDGEAYSVGYNRQATRLYRGTDGRNFQVLVPALYQEGYPNEATLRFLPDGSALCLLRRDGKGTDSALLGTARPPYREWSWKDLGVRIGGPNLIPLPGGRWVAAVRLYEGGVRTSLCLLDPAQGRLEELLALPSGGDTSYAGLVFHRGLLWVSYYSSHEGRASIYLAKVRIQ